MCLIGLPCIAQSNEKVDSLLVQIQARTDAVSYLVLTAGGKIAETTEPEAAYAAAVAAAALAPGRQASEPIRIDDFCFLVMRTFSLKGGMMYTLFPGPRYAYRELVSLGIVNPGGGPNRTVPGDEVLMVLRRVMELKGGTR
jgi:hypothetical protein